MNKFKIYLAVLILSVWTEKSQAQQNPFVIFKNNKAVSDFEKDKIFESKKVLEKEVVNSPKTSALHYNLGVLNETSKQTDVALKEYLSSVETANDQNLKFQALFNIARLYGEQKNIPDALKYYQAALEIIPDSKEVKTNIEMLFQNSSGGGGNNSDQQEQSDNQDQNQDQKPQQGPPQNQPQQQSGPKQFKSKDLSEQDVRRILDELKRQEEQIRAKMNNQKSKETPVEKDW